jgi:hypothetical protein
MVPQTTKSLAQGAESERHRQAKAYDMDRANNHRQMDDIRHAQYRKQNTAVKQQKSHMQDNAAKASKRVTGSSDYYKESKTLSAFLEQLALPAAGETGKKQDDVIDVEVKDVTDKRRERTDRAVDKVRGMSKGQYRANKDRREEESVARASRRDEERRKAQEDKEKKKREEKGFLGRLKKRAFPGDRGAKAADMVYDAPKNIAKGALKGAKFLGKGALGIARANAGVRTGTSSSAPSTSGVSKVND